MVRLGRLNTLSACWNDVTVCLDGSGLNLNGLLLGFHLYLSSNLLDEASVSRISVMTALRRSSVTPEQRILLVSGGRSRFRFLVPRENRVLHSRVYSSL